MSDVTKIKLPDNSELNIKDYRIPGVDSTPTSGSNNVVTSGGIHTAIVDTELVVATALNDLNDRVSDLEDGAVTESYVDAAVAGIVNSAPTTLDTLNELATALGNDPNFATTVATQIGQKIDTVKVGTTDYTPTNGTVSLPAYPAAQVQSDWNAVSGVGVILNKPDVPSIIFRTW